MSEVIEPDGNGAAALIEGHVQINAQARDRGAFHGICGAGRQRRQALLRFRQRAGEELALGPVELQREAELVTALPRILRQQGRTRGEIGERRGIGGRGLGALAREQVELGQLLALVPCGDQRGAAVELIDDLEDRILPLLRWCVGREQPADTQMRRDAQLLRDQRIRGFLDAVMEKPVATFRAEHEPRSYRFPKVAVHAPFQILVNHRQEGDLCAVAHAGKLLQGLLRFEGQAIQLSNHEVDHVVGIPLGQNATEVPGPSRIAMIEGEQCLFGERRNELDGEKWIACRPVVHQLRERRDAVRFAAKRIRQQPSQIFTGQGCKDDLLHSRSPLADCIELASQGMN